MAGKQIEGFCIDFDTRVEKNKIDAVRVRLDVITMGLEDVADLGLCEHPLYPKLVRYVKDNPYREP